MLLDSGERVPISRLAQRKVPTTPRGRRHTFDQARGDTQHPKAFCNRDRWHSIRRCYTCSPTSLPSASARPLRGLRRVWWGALLMYVHYHGRACLSRPSPPKSRACAFSMIGGRGRLNAQRAPGLGFVARRLRGVVSNRPRPRAECAGPERRRASRLLRYRRQNAGERGIARSRRLSVGYRSRG
jgi:hypothetical protein